jgi:cell division septum initiation protein DivIVA
MARSLIERRLHDVTTRLTSLRHELAVLDEQLAVFNDAADEARLRALVSETPLADREQREASRHADAMTRSRADLAARVSDLERRQDELLDRLVAETG